MSFLLLRNKDKFCPLLARLMALARSNYVSLAGANLTFLPPSSEISPLSFFLPFLKVGFGSKSLLGESKPSLLLPAGTKTKPRSE